MFRAVQISYWVANVGETSRFGLLPKSLTAKSRHEAAGRNPDGISCTSCGVNRATPTVVSIHNSTFHSAVFSSHRGPLGVFGWILEIGPCGTRLRF